MCENGSRDINVSGGVSNLRDAVSHISSFSLPVITSLDFYAFSQILEQMRTVFSPVLPVLLKLHDIIAYHPVSDSQQLIYGSLRIGTGYIMNMFNIAYQIFKCQLITHYNSPYP